MGNAQSQQNDFCNVCINFAGNEVIVTIYEDKTIEYVRKEVQSECDIGDTDFRLFVLLNGFPERLERNEDVVDLVEGRLLGSSKAPTIYVELVGASTDIVTPRAPRDTNPANPIASPTTGQQPVGHSATSGFPTGEKFDVMLSYQWNSKEKVKCIYDELVASGFKVWMDLDQMHGDIYQRMAEGVVSSKIFSPCLTLAYSKSENCLAEIEYARVLRKAMVPNLAWKSAAKASLDQTFAELSRVGLMTAGLVFVDFSEVEPDHPNWADCISNLKVQINKRLAELEPLVVLSNASISQSTLPLPQQTHKLDILKEWLKPVDIESDLNSYAESYVSGTRHWLLERINKWIADPEASQVMWLRGGAGVGKSIMAWFIGAYLSRSLPKQADESLESDPQIDTTLGAQFYCKFNNSLKNDPHCVIQSIAYQLGLVDSRIHSYLSGLCQQDQKSNPSLLDLDVTTKFDKLVLQPLKQITGHQKIVIILDALDECGQAGGKNRKRLLAALANSANVTPKNVKLLVTSRPEPDVYSILQNIHCTELRPNDSENLKDIKVYVYERLKTYLGINKKLLDQAVDHLSAAADGVFVWMRLVCDLIRSKSPQTEDEAMLIISAQGRGIDSMYHQLLENALQNSGGSAENFRRVYGILCVVREPVSSGVLAELLNMEGTLVTAELLRYRFLIETMSSGATKFVHKSVNDFLTSASRCSDSRFSIDTKIYETIVLQRCLDIMMSDLRPNIAELSSRIIYDKTPAAAVQKVPPAVSYSCRYWVEHLLAVPDNLSDILPEMKRFSEKHLLSWAEVMVIYQNIQTAIGQLEKLSSQMAVANDMSENLRTISATEIPEDHPDISSEKATKFIETITMDLARVLEYNLFPISKCPLQLYCTGLAFCPTQTELWNTYRYLLDETFPAVKFTIGRELSWSPQLWTHELSNNCTSVKYSPDGTMIAAATGKEVIILDVQFHTILLTLEGHSDWVQSVAWSHDGTKLLSGADDKIVRLWSTITGEQLMKLEGHSSSVYSVAWSPDGRMIASGSRDMTVRLWSSAAGEQLMKMEEHSNSVYSVAWSHDGTKLVSGSSDKTVRLWSATKGEQLMKFEGHSNWVQSVALSHDGKIVVSGSSDSTVRVWSATTGGQLLKLEGHSNSVYSVALSYDSTKVVSGSSDNSVRVWSATTGEELMNLVGHNSYVNSVAWSNDGTKIVSGSSDSTLIVWSSTTGEQPNKVKGHSSTIWSVSWSQDGTKALSRALDGREIVWSAVTGHQLVGESLGDEDGGEGSGNIELQIDSEGWAFMGDYMFWLSAEMRGETFESMKGVCVINASKLYCFAC